MEPLPSTGLPRYRTIVALDIERSTSRPDPVKAELRNKTYELFDAALCSAGIHKRHRDRFIDRGDGILALIHPVDQAPKALLLNRAIPALSRLLADHNTSLPRSSRPQRQLRVRVVMHAGEVHYDANGCFGEALDLAFRLLDAARVKRALRETADPLILVISGDIYGSIVRHGYDGIDQHAFRQLVRVQIAGNRHPGRICTPEQAMPHQVTQLTRYPRPA
jgi:class 3 adenylate cyclase